MCVCCPIFLAKGHVGQQMSAPDLRADVVAFYRKSLVSGCAASSPTCFLPLAKSYASHTNPIDLVLFYFFDTVSYFKAVPE